MVKKNAPEKKPSEEAIIEEPKPQKRGVIAAVLPILAGVVLMVGSAWAFTEFFLLKKITEKLAVVNLEMKDPSVKNTENPKSEAEKSPSEVKPEDRDFLENMIAGVKEADLPDAEQKAQFKVWKEKKKEKFEGPFETKVFNQLTEVGGVNRYLIAKFEIDCEQSRAHREKLYQILTDKKSFINDQTYQLIASLSSFKDIEEVYAKNITVKTQLYEIVKRHVTNKEIEFSVLTVDWNVQ